jgi:hypothetical protein
MVACAPPFSVSPLHPECPPSICLNISIQVVLGVLLSFELLPTIAVVDLFRYREALPFLDIKVFKSWLCSGALCRLPNNLVIQNSLGSHPGCSIHVVNSSMSLVPPTCIFTKILLLPE